MVNTLERNAVTAAATAAIRAAEAATGDVRAPDSGKTYVSLNATNNVVDEEGLPEAYDARLIEAYWKKQGSALQSRWTEFLGIAVPFITRTATLTLSGGVAALEREAGSLARDARQNMEKLGPTYVKLGQMMSVRPDVLPDAALAELAILQDSVKPFDSAVAFEVIEKELGRPVDEVFSKITPEPIAAASLAQVYRATLREDGREVAVKVQRPDVLSTVSKDLYVLRRAAEVYQNLMGMLAPQQRTDYVALLNEWAIGFYTELDFKNEAMNQQRLAENLERENVQGVLVPEIVFATRRLLVSEWIDGTKLSDCPPEELSELIAIGQEAFLVQLLQFGIFHADPHPGNLMKLPEGRADGKKLALLDFGLVASIEQSDRDTMVSALIHLANKDYASLVEDFVLLDILPADTNRATVIPLMDKALTPYIQGGGAQRYADEVRRTYGIDDTVSGTAGGFQQITGDMLTVLNEVPFAIPPYFALLARAIITLEGIALTGNPDYALVLEAYPFVARKLLSDDRPGVQKALQEALYGSGGKGVPNARRFASLLNSALGIVERSGGGAVDLDRVPEDGVEAGEALAYVFSNGAASLRELLGGEAETAGDLILRQTLRRAVVTLDARARSLVPPLPFLRDAVPSPLDVPGPLLLPQLAADGSAAPSSLRSGIVTPREVVDALAPPLDRTEEIYLLSLADLAKETLGPDAAAVVNGDAASTDPLAALRLLVNVAEAQTGALPGTPAAAGLDALRRVAYGIPPDPRALFRGRAPAPAQPTHIAQDGHAMASSASTDPNTAQNALADMSRALAALDVEQRVNLNASTRKLVDAALRKAYERLEPLVA